MQFAFTQRKALAVVAASIASALVLSACSDGSGDPSPSGSSAAPAADAPTDLSIAIQKQPGTFDVVNATEGTDAYVWASIYERLFEIDAEGNVVGQAAESYEYNDDATELTVTLRDGLTFSDGTAVTAADYAATVEYSAANPGPNQQKFFGWTAEAVDDKTIVISLEEPQPGLIYNLAMVAGVIAQEETVDDEAMGTSPIGSGPYVLDETATVTGSTYALVKRDDYWAADEYPFDDVTVNVISDPTAIENAVRSGEIDIAPVQPTTRATFEGNADFTISDISGTSMLFLLIADREGTIQPALADLGVRQALNMAFDRNALAQAVTAGIGQPTQQVIYPGQPGYDEALNETYDFDVEGAKALLAEAGYPDGFSVTMPSLVYTAQIEPLVTQALADIGVTVEWVSVPPQDTVSAVASGEYAMTLWFDGYSFAPETVARHYYVDAFQNPFHVVDPELTALLDAAAVEPDLDAAAGIYEDINSFVVDNAWDAPLIFNAASFVSREGYAYVGTQFQQFSTLRQFGVA